MAVVKHGGRPARTDWRIEETFRDYALLRCFPRTGKTHQVRVHLAHIGLPLVVDPLYNRGRGGRGATSGQRSGPARVRSGPACSGLLLSDFKRDYRGKRDAPERPLIDRLTLHAEKLRFEHPDGRRVELVAEWPRDLWAVMNQLRRNARG